MAEQRSFQRQPGRMASFWEGNNTGTRLSKGSTVSNSSLHFYSMVVGPLQCNCTLIVDKNTKEALLVDPGGDADKIIAQINTLGVKLRQVITTHGHLDHFLVAGDIKARYPDVQLILNKEDLFLWSALEKQAQGFLGPNFKVVQPPTPDIFADDHLDIALNGKIITTPGHSPGSICVLFEEEKTIFTGDTLFFLSVGRTDLWGGDFNTLKKSICRLYSSVDDDTYVIPGHNQHTTIGVEKKSNQFITFDQCNCKDPSHSHSHL